ncbi:PREDICTED: probable alpha,alpha-trehalose-phosphate synthase [UDP-forming] 9 [Tarenaya hassleriana]|uniref:probable alpha,alpha-trehalose-phosphate synthase [UDP-forming] 9 n=1 Tax=Tarenaya hassleriana TaxID=28532 RepID=UPI00053C0EA3|nr:PREDICTED: probable alpha,alpha-trehalose-phosphate synthase [UDP-forming] 9 [Tarenaya hassleriana]XP_010533499.1 PREDICTED: probable alpha,alpha-trehalose-phosphate synthase [UDP-forming] 9 [Tarenaya hassleriana]XP_010533501.1 PREDICTED: probable alpha,alpha-trehalose-phosphate synthase [UDP-forming] 9 [Tarenaya hassleriana]
MFSGSCGNLLELESGDMYNFPQAPKLLPRVMTLPGVIPEEEDSDSSRVESREKKIIVANHLPLNAEKDSESGEWRFSYDEDSLLLQLKDALPPGTVVVYVGSLKVEIEANEQEQVSQKLLEKFNCVPTFLPPDLHQRYYQGFCKHYLWPLFHYMLPIFQDYDSWFDKTLWQSYLTVNKRFADKVMEVLNAEDDFVWVHDYHLMVMPTFLRRRFHRVKLGFFLHSPFPSSEIYKTLPVRVEILRGLLNADQIGFQTFDYARHFLSCCRRMLGLTFESKRGHIGLEYLGRTIYVRILPVGIHMGRLEYTLNHPSSAAKAKEIKEQYAGKTVILGLDDMDIFKGISLKLLAIEQLLQHGERWCGNLVLIQIINPERSPGRDINEAKREIYEVVERINHKFGSPGYVPVVLINRLLPRHEKTAYYAVAECCIVNAVRDGMNLVPYKYVVCRQGSSKMDEALEISPESPHTSTLVISEFIGCSPSLSGAIRVNPWDITGVADSLAKALTMTETEKQLRHEKHYKYVSSHDVSYWAKRFLQDLERACKEHYINRCWGLGFGITFRVLSLPPNFRKLSIDHIAPVYERTSRRAIFLDYDGTVVSDSSIIKSPGDKVTTILNDLCNDPRNTVFIVSGRDRDTLSGWFSGCGKLGIAAEHGYFIRWYRNSGWETCCSDLDFDWKGIALPVMTSYTEATDGSYIESKETALVWQHKDADPDFGCCQAKELQDHLESVLANEPVVVTSGNHIVEVKPQGVTKGETAKKILSKLIEDGKPLDFVLCVGDDRSDEDMFGAISDMQHSSAPEIFACTVGQKPSKAKYYLDDSEKVLELLKGLGTKETEQGMQNSD